MGHHLIRAYARYLALLAGLLALWFVLSGYFDKPALVAFGVMSVGLCVYLAERAGALDPEGVPTGVFPGIIPYMMWLTLEIGKANIAVAREVLRPNLRLSPKMFRVKAVPKSDLGKTIFGNSITLTPGTVTVDVEEDWIVIHGLTEELADVAGIEDMGRKVCALDRPDGQDDR